MLLYPGGWMLPELSLLRAGLSRGERTEAYGCVRAGRGRGYIWPSGRPGSARPGHGPGTARWCRAGTARRAPRAVPYRASCPVDSPSTAPRAEIRAVPPAQPGQNLRAVPAHNPNCRKPLIRFLINSTFIILTSHSQNHKNNLTI